MKKSYRKLVVNRLYNNRFYYYLRKIMEESHKRFKRFILESLDGNSLSEICNVSKPENI